MASDEPKVVAWRYLSGAPGAKWTVQKNHPKDVSRWPNYTVEPLYTASDLASARAQGRREGLAAAEAELLALREALASISAFSGQTLISVTHGQPYSIGANAAFEETAAIARAALTPKEPS